MGEEAVAMARRWLVALGSRPVALGRRRVLG